MQRYDRGAFEAARRPGEGEAVAHQVGEEGLEGAHEHAAGAQQHEHVALEEEVQKVVDLEHEEGELVADGDVAVVVAARRPRARASRQREHDAGRGFEAF